MPQSVCVRAGKSFSLSAVAERVKYELESMGYSTALSEDERGMTVALRKDVGGMDTVLGRWQCSVIRISEKNGEVSAFVERRKHADKVLAFVLGGFFWALPWICEWRAAANRKNAEQVALHIVYDYTRKNYPV